MVWEVRQTHRAARGANELTGSVNQMLEHDRQVEARLSADDPSPALAINDPIQL